ncbi:hypothetical protein, partial [Atlantibacter hermannii]
RCPRQNMKTSIINGSEVSKLSVAIQSSLTVFPQYCEKIPFPMVASASGTIQNPYFQTEPVSSN